MKKANCLLILQYVTTTQRISSDSKPQFTGFELFNAQNGAMDYYQKLLPPEFHTQKEAILTKHGYTKETWKEVLDRPMSFWMGYSEQEEACNKDIKKLCNKYDHISSIARLPNYFYSLLNNLVKTHPTRVSRKKINGIYYYSLA